MRKTLLPLICLLLANMAALHGQNLPREMHISNDGRHLVTGRNASEGLYDESTIQVIELWFEQANYWQQLTNNYQSSTDLPAIMIVNGDTLPAKVGVRFKGQTSYNMIQNSQKKSFNITINYEDEGQQLDGYETLNLNNCFEDPSFMREVMYLHQSRKHIPSLKGSYVHLYINGENWGPYPSIQGLNGEYLKEWFLSNDGTRWRALRTDAGPGGPGGGGGGGIFGTGVSSLNYLGADTSLYIPKYTLKKANKEHPWEDLVNTCDALNNTPLASLEDTIQHYLDLDRTLWYLAHEIIFSDDDSYVHKGGMDYYIYWEPETGRITPLEYDGNSCMKTSAANWSPFYHETDNRYPLMNRLFAVPSIRQRYLAHVRTIIQESLDTASFNHQIDNYFEMINDLVQADNKKLYAYSNFLTEKEALKSFALQRRNFLLANAEVNTTGPAISDVTFTAGGNAFAAPNAGQEVSVTAHVNAGVGINAVNLYYGTGFVGQFSHATMFDDGNHGDGQAGDGMYGAVIPGFSNGVYVRFYVEAIANNTPHTASYMPVGAEHDVFVYQVNVSAVVDSDVVINELMASNTNTAADANGQYDDWIELYNKSAGAINLSGWYLTDNEQNLTKWEFPEGTMIPGHGYLIVWADEDGSQEGLHANFKLSASGEILMLLDPNTSVAQNITFGQQETDKGYARVPNGTGNFVIQAPTFNTNNNLSTGTTQVVLADKTFVIYPNPTGSSATVRLTENQSAQLQVFTSLGQKIMETRIDSRLQIDVSQWEPGIYWVKVGAAAQKLLVR